MENIKTTVLSAVVALVVALGVILSGGHSTTKQATPTPGALAGPDIASPYIRWGGVTIFQSAMAFSATSSVPCSLQNPSSATSTLTSFTVVLTGGTNNVALTYDVSTSTSPYATSTPALIYAGSIPSTNLVNTAWLPGAASSATILGGTRADGETVFSVTPSGYVNLRIATSSAGVFATQALTGTCTATFRVNSAAI